MIEVLLGFISGIVSGTGMGGGAILITLLSIYRGLDQYTAQATNLIFFIPTAISAIFINIRNKKVNFKIAKPIILYGLIGIIIGTSISSRIQVDNLRKYFGVFLFIIAIYEIYGITIKKKS